MKPLADPISNTCFMSCVKIIGQDLSFDLDIREFIDRFPDLCFRGTDKEGAFHVTRENLCKVSGKMGFTATLLYDLKQGLLDEYVDESRVLLSYHKFLGNEEQLPLSGVPQIN